MVDRLPPNGLNPASATGSVADEAGFGSGRQESLARPAAKLKFHALRHTYASLCVVAGIPPLEIARFI